MKWTPLLFSDDMACAMVEHRKWHTRRLKGLAEVNQSPNDWTLWALRLDPTIENLSTGKPLVMKGLIATFERPGTYMNDYINVRCPFGQVGDWIWGREAWRKGISDGGICVEYRSDGDRRYFDDYPDNESDWFSISDEKWRPSIFMPRWASRIERELVGIRLERLQAITEADAQAEGVAPSGVGRDLDHLKYRAGFLTKWDAINAQQGYPFAHNPWVWVLEFPH